MSQISVASEISRIHDTIQEGLKRDEAVYTKLEVLVDVLKSRNRSGGSESRSGALTASSGSRPGREESLAAENAALKVELQGMNILLQQNGQLEREIARLCVELEEVTQGVLQRGYLYKWRDRDISYASKWGLRYFVLQGSMLSYYGDDRDTSRPRRTFDMTQCVVRDEGTKKNGTFFVFSIYANGNFAGGMSSEGQQVLLRLSSESRGEADQWMHMLERASESRETSSNTAAGGEEGVGTKVIVEQGMGGLQARLGQGGMTTHGDPTLGLSMSATDLSSSVRGRSNNPFDDDHNDDHNLGALTRSRLDLNLQTDNLNLGPMEQNNPDALSPVTLTRVKSSNAALATAANLLLKRRPSLVGSTGPSPVPVRPFKPAAFPGSRPMHLERRASALSSEARPQETNYRGFFHLGVIILIVSHLRVIFENLMQYGLLMRVGGLTDSITGGDDVDIHARSSLGDRLKGLWGSMGVGQVMSQMTATASFSSSSSPPTSSFAGSLGCTNTEQGSVLPPAFCSDGGASSAGVVIVVLMTWMLTVGVVWLVEVWAAYMMVRLSATKTSRESWLSKKLDTLVLLAHWVLGIVNAFGPILWVWHQGMHPIGSMVYLGQSVVLWMKMISYAHVNRDSRKAAYVRLVVDMQVCDGGGASTLVNKAANRPYQDKTDVDFAAMRDVEKPFLQYPSNLTLGNMLYFCVAPTLCYQLNYPRSPRVRLRYLGTILARLVVVTGLILFFVEQHMAPTLSGLEAWEQGPWTGLERLLRLSIPNTYVWLLGFYWFFHLWLNLLAELTRFGDRLFYKDWWNARTIEVYWRHWNLPVHHWLLRHVYYPTMRMGLGKGRATTVVFLLSAILHEVIISVPFKVLSLHAFFGMLFQAPLIWVTKKIDRIFNNALAGNITFWLVFCVIGQPIGIILIYLTHQQVQQR